MKKRVLLVMAVSFLFIPLLMAQEVPSGVIAALSKGSSQELSKYMGDKVHLILPDKSANVDRQRATAMMQDFFAQNKIDGFSINHQGKRDESGFIIGTLKSSNGKFRVNCFLKKSEEQYVIHQIRIDKIHE